jgi:toxin FitB
LKFLLDTNIISEIRKPVPSTRVLDWLSGITNEHLFISVVTLGEINRGITKLPAGKKKNDLIKWFDRVQEAYQYQTFSIDNDIALKWGELTARSEREGIILPVLDGLIAATAYVHGAILVTRNTKDFQSANIQVLNPWL